MEAREIKFRVWNCYQNWMLYFDLTEVDNGCVWDRGHKYHLFNEEMIIMECRGLKDKNDKEIFEEDIVMLFEKKYVVRWIKSSAHFSFETPDGKGEWAYGDFMPNKEDLEIIGNIYENKSLLEESERLKRAVAAGEVKRAE